MLQRLGIGHCSASDMLLHIYGMSRMGCVQDFVMIPFCYSCIMCFCALMCGVYQYNARINSLALGLSYDGSGASEVTLTTMDNIDHSNHSGYGLIQRKTTLHGNVVTHWLSPNPNGPWSWLSLYPWSLDLYETTQKRRAPWTMSIRWTIIMITKHLVLCNSHDLIC